MTKSKHTKRALLASVLSVVLCASMLVGSTFAWFTDSVTSGTNTIVAGNLDVTLKYGTPSADKTAFEGDWKDVTGVDSLFTGNLWEPGHTEVVYLEIANAGSLALKYQFSINFTETGSVNVYDDEFKLSTYLKYAVVGLDGTTPVPYKDRAAALTAAGAGTDLAAYTEESKPLLSGEKRYVALVVWMPETVGNEANYKAGEAAPTIDLGIELLASQTPHESDSFGTNYDEGAAYLAPVSTADELVDAAANGGAVKLTEEITLTTDLSISKDLIIDMNGQTLNVSGSLKAPVGTTLTVQGDGILNGTLYADGKFGNGGTVIVDAGDDFQLMAPSENGYTVYGAAGSTVRINGGTYTSTENKENTGVVHMLGSTLEIRNATFNVGANTVMNAYGIHSNAKSSYLENVTVNAKYSIAANFNNALGKTIIRGGSFVTDKRADDEFYSPTIRYQGTLDISDASITRVGMGIQCSALNTTEVTGLTQENLTFIKAIESITEPEIGHK